MTEFVRPERILNDKSNKWKNGSQPNDEANLVTWMNRQGQEGNNPRSDAKISTHKGLSTGLNFPKHAMIGHSIYSHTAFARGVISIKAMTNYY